MSEVPKTGGWYEDKIGTRVVVIGMASKFRAVVEHECGTIGLMGDWNTWRHLPGCTGWGWEEPKVLDARSVLEKLALEAGVDPLGVDSADLAEMIVLANKKREQHNIRQMPLEFTGREKDLLEAIANLRDNMDRLATRVVNLEQRTMPYQTIGGSVR